MAWAGCTQGCGRGSDVASIAASGGMPGGERKNRGNQMSKGVAQGLTVLLPWC